MELFDKITKKASETYKGAAEKTGKIAKEAKLKIKINDNKSKINDLYKEIGRKVYEKHVTENSVCVKKDIEEECAKIDILALEIETYNKEILNLSNIKVCIKCKEPIDKAAKFCPKCGEVQPKIEEEPVIEAEVVTSNDDLDEENNDENRGNAETTHFEEERDKLENEEVSEVEIIDEEN